MEKRIIVYVCALSIKCLDNMGLGYLQQWG